MNFEEEDDLLQDIEDPSTPTKAHTYSLFSDSI